MELESDVSLTELTYQKKSRLSFTLKISYLLEITFIAKEVGRFI